MRRGVLGLVCLGIGHVSTTSAMGAGPGNDAPLGGAEPLKTLPKWEPPMPGYQVQPWEASPPALATSNLGGGGGPPPEPLVQDGNPFLYGDTPLGGPAANNRPQLTQRHPEYPNSKYPYSDAGDRDRRQCMMTCLLQVASYFSSPTAGPADPAQVAEAQMGVIAGCNPSALGAPSIVAGVPLLMGSKLRSIDFSNKAVQQLVSAMAANVLSGGSGSGTTMAAHVLVNQLMSMPGAKTQGTKDAKGANGAKGAKGTSSKNKGTAGEPGEVLTKWLMVASLQSGANRESVNGLLLDMLLARTPAATQAGAKAKPATSKMGGKGTAGSETTDTLLKFALLANAGGASKTDVTVPPPTEAYVADVHHRCMETILSSHPPPPMQALDGAITSCVNSQLQARQADYLRQREHTSLEDEHQNSMTNNPLLLSTMMKPTGQNADMSQAALSMMLAQQKSGRSLNNPNSMAQQYLMMHMLQGDSSGSSEKPSSGTSKPSSKSPSNGDPSMAILSALAMQPNQGVGPNPMLQQYFMTKLLQSGSSGANKESSNSKSKSGGGGGGGEDTGMGGILALMLAHQQGVQQQQNLANAPLGGGGNVAGNNLRVGQMITADPKAKPEDVAGNMGVISSGAMMGVAGQPIHSTGSVYGACISVVLNGLIGDIKLKGKDIEPQIAQCTVTGNVGMSNGDLACMACLNKEMAEPTADTKKSADLLPLLNSCVVYTLWANTPNTVNPVASAVAVQARAEGPAIKVLDDVGDDNYNEKTNHHDVMINIGDRDDDGKDGENSNQIAQNPSAPVYPVQSGFVDAQPTPGLIEVSSGLAHGNGEMHSLLRVRKRTSKLRGGAK